MLFVSLLQGFGLLPGKAATKLSGTAADVDSNSMVAPDTAVAEKTLPRSSKTGITRELPTVAQSAKGQAVAPVPASGSEKSPRRQAVKQTAEKPSKTDSKAPATQGSASKAAKVAAIKPVPAAPVAQSVKPTAQAAGKTPASAGGNDVAKVKATAATGKKVGAKVAPVAAAKPSKAVSQAAVVQPATSTKPAPKSATKAVAATVKTPVASASKSEPAKSGSVAKAAVVTPSVPAVVPPATRRGGRKSAAVSVPVPQPVPSHSPDAAKATFSNIPERVMTLPVHTPARKDPKLANNWKNKTADQLTDEEVLSMPDAEYMNDTQMAFFRHKLVTLKNGILANAGETTEHLREDTVVVPDPADRATIEEEHALELRTRDRERKLLKKIEQSIARIDAGDYGYCDETGEPIGVGRLIARPTANLSLEAQQRRELKQKMFGD